ELNFDAAALRPGDYQVQVRLLGPNKQVIETATLPVRKAAADEGQPDVFIDEHNRTLVHGKPFFPLGWYFGPTPKDINYQEHLDRLAGSPFNTIMCYGINNGTIADVRAYLDALAQRNLKIIYSIKDVYPEITWYKDEQLGFQGEDAIVNGVVSTFRDHPAVLGWYLNDELPLSMRERLEARYRQVRNLDPNHPTWAVLYQVDELAGYLNTADVLGTDPYPLPQKPVTMAAEWTKKSAAISGGKRPLWQVPQAHDWACYNKDPQAKHRPPTLDEEMVMSYLCLIHGANGLIYYSYFDLQRDSLGFNRRWAEMLVVGNEMKQLIPALLSTAAAPKLAVQADSKSVEYSQRADDAGKQYVLMANPDNAKAAVVSVKVPAGAQLAQLRHATLETLTARDGQCRVRLAPMSAATLIVTP
ncbi:MAG TPA: hypothetical protein VHR86_09555, partial [Armatimonadota bacterium]|nr:hypothetical protein [Armatimonadota bacterium]